MGMQKKRATERWINLYVIQ